MKLGLLCDSHLRSPTEQGRAGWHQSRRPNAVLTLLTSHTGAMSGLPDGRFLLLAVSLWALLCPGRLYGPGHSFGAVLCLLPTPTNPLIIPRIIDWLKACTVE